MRCGARTAGVHLTAWLMLLAVLPLVLCPFFGGARPSLAVSSPPLFPFSRVLSGRGVSRSSVAPSSCSVPRAWNGSLSGCTFDLVYAPSSCHLVCLSTCVLASSLSSIDSAACAPALYQIDYTTGTTVSSLPFPLPTAAQLDSPPVLHMTHDEALVLGAVTLNQTSEASVSHSCGQLRAIHRSSTELTHAWSVTQCRPESSDQVLFESTTAVVVGQGGKGDLVLWFDRSSSSLASITYPWRVLSATTGQQLSQVTSDALLSANSIAVHGQAGCISVVVSPSTDLTSSSLLLYNLTSTGQLALFRDASHDWDWEQWSALPVASSTWVLNSQLNASLWKGVDVLTGSTVWAVDDDPILAGRWPYSLGQHSDSTAGSDEAWRERTRSGATTATPSKVYTECSFTELHPYNSSLFIVATIALERVAGQNDTMWGVFAVYSANTGQRLSESGALGPIPVFDRTVYCGERVLSFVDESAIVVLVERHWFALDPVTARTLSQGELPLIPDIHGKWPMYEWQMLSLQADQQQASALLITNAGWTAGYTIPSQQHSPHNTNTRRNAQS